MIEIGLAALSFQIGDIGRFFFVYIAEVEVGDRVGLSFGLIRGVTVRLTLRLAVFVLARGGLHHYDVAVFVIEQYGPDEIFKVAVFAVFFDAFQRLFVLEITPRLIVIQPCVGYLDVVVQPLCQARGAALAQIELRCAELSSYSLLIETRGTFSQA